MNKLTIAFGTTAFLLTLGSANAEHHESDDAANDNPAHESCMALHDAMMARHEAGEDHDATMASLSDADREQMTTCHDMMGHGDEDGEAAHGEHGMARAGHGEEGHDSHGSQGHHATQPAPTQEECRAMHDHMVALHDDSTDENDGNMPEIMDADPERMMACHTMMESMDGGHHGDGDMSGQGEMHHDGEHHGNHEMDADDEAPSHDHD